MVTATEGTFQYHGGSGILAASDTIRDSDLVSTEQVVDSEVAAVADTEEVAEVTEVAELEDMADKNTNVLQPEAAMTAEAVYSNQAIRTVMLHHPIIIAFSMPTSSCQSFTRSCFTNSTSYLDSDSAFCTETMTS
jgi:hypothetical protein